ncbi:hypothetical protein [Rhodococcus kronopolitis]|uniref:Uncharacterized protein n=1 Tax=Rhodococcus kronopolitis TaxID=1460226 RepID=A0ABV9FTM7_9NOCA
MSIRDMLGRAETVSALDTVGDAMQTRILRGLADRPVAGILRGTWLGHPVHPMTVTVPLDAWTSSLVLDLVFRDHVAARRMIGFSLLTVPPALATVPHRRSFTPVNRLRPVLHEQGHQRLGRRPAGGSPEAVATISRQRRWRPLLLSRRVPPLLEITAPQWVLPDEVHLLHAPGPLAAPAVPSSVSGR